MCLTASRKQRNHCGGGSGCHVREENVPFLPSPAAWKLLAAAADSHTLSFLFMSNTGNQSLRPVEPALGDGTRSVASPAAGSSGCGRTRGSFGPHSAPRSRCRGESHSPKTPCSHLTLSQRHLGEVVCSKTDWKDRPHHCCVGDLILQGDTHKDELPVRSACRVREPQLRQSDLWETRAYNRVWGWRG